MGDSERKAFDETKLGVKGLIDAGITNIPQMFYHPPDYTKNASELLDTKNYINIPVIDLANIHQDSCAHKRVVEGVKDASQTWVFFHIVNHGIPLRILREIKDGVQSFFEQDSEVKKKFYTREQRPFMYNSNFNLYTSAPISWKDSFLCNMAPNPPKSEDLPAICRDILVEYMNHVMKLGNLLLELLSEALGLNPTYLTDIGCSDGLSAFAHYYPPCPEPELTLGTIKHSDVDFITVLLQDHIGGLQFLHKDLWVDIPPLSDALIVNIGDLLQLISNDKFKSTQHRVKANLVGPRVTIASFFSIGHHSSSRIYGPIKELLSENNPPKYRETLISDCIDHFKVQGMNGMSPLLHFRI